MADRVTDAGVARRHVGGGYVVQHGLYVPVNAHASNLAGGAVAAALGGNLVVALAANGHAVGFNLILSDLLIDAQVNDPITASLVWAPTVAAAQNAQLDLVTKRTNPGGGLTGAGTSHAWTHAANEAVNILIEDTPQTIDSTPTGVTSQYRIVATRGNDGLTIVVNVLGLLVTYPKGMGL